MRYVIVADDFTGANDTGVQMRRRGFETSVIFGGRKIPSGAEAAVIDTESRGLNADEAGRVTADAMKELTLTEETCVIKKVDSTLRGNVAVEVRAVDRAQGSGLVIFAPALPDLNRTTEDGIHRLGGVPITKTEIAKDPRKPVTEDRLQKILQAVYDEPVEHVGLADIRGGKIDLSRARVYTFDSVLNSDLQAVIQAAKKFAGKSGKKILWVGSAALADNIMELESPTPPAFGLVASVSAVTNGQLHTAEKNGVALIKIPVHNILSKQETLKPYLEQTADSLRAGRDTILCSSSSYDRDELELSAQAGAKLGMELPQVSEFVQKLMGDAAKELFEGGVKVSGVFTTGGDTAMGLLRSLNADGSHIVSEITMGLPMMRLAGGPMDGLKLVTKAGAFGNEDAILFAFRKLKEK